MRAADWHRAWSAIACAAVADLPLPPVHLAYVVFAGVFLCGTVIHLFRARSAESPQLHWFLAVLCAVPVAYMLLVVAEFDATSTAVVGTLRRAQAGAACTFLICYPWFLVKVTRVRDRWAPFILSAVGAAMLVRGVTSPTGLWMSSLDGIRATILPWGEVIHQAHGERSHWMLVTLLVWVALTAYGIACAERYRRQKGSIGAIAIMAFHCFFFVAVVNDMLVSAGWIHSISLSVFSAPILVWGMWWRVAVEERRRLQSLRTLFGASAEAILIADAADGAIRETNAAAWELLGETRAPLAGRPIGDLVEPADRPRFLDALERAARARTRDAAMLEVRCRHGGGEPFPAQVTLRAQTLEAIDCVVASLRDVSALKRAEADKIQLQLQMLQAQRLEGLGVLAEGIAHDFNNILTAILGRLGMAERAAEASARAEHLSQASTAVRRASGLCQQLLVYAGKGQAQVAELDCSALVDEMSTMLEVTVPRPIAFERDLGAGLPPIRGDVNQLRQVVMNLITNAAEAIGQRTGRIELRTRACRVSEVPGSDVVRALPASGMCIALEVSDNGCGMDEATRRRMFEPFFTTKFTGRGLGLAAVLGIIRDHRAGLRVVSAPGRGTTIGVYFPVASDAAPALAPAPTTPYRADQRCLVVDDDDAVRDLTVALIESLGFQAASAGSGAEAVRAMEERGRDFALAVIDMTMPGMDGKATIAALRARQADLPVILTSGYAISDVAAWSGTQPGIVFQGKPYDGAMLARAAARALGQAVGSGGHGAL